MNNKHVVLGVMSGTSLDGIDLALCEFNLQNNNWKYKIISAETVQYEDHILKMISGCHKMPGYELISFHSRYGNYLGNKINDFIAKVKLKPDLISSHGHTVFHTPDQGVTFQIGNGSNIAATTKITTVSDFRAFDVALGGQGAPLVPVGDELLFGDYDYCINIGGFANTSFKVKNKRLAYDICPANILFNYYAKLLNQEFDKDGINGRKGEINNKLLHELNSLNYYQLPYPKSLGREWATENIFPVIQKFNLEVTDTLRTIYEHVAEKIAGSTGGDNEKKILITGGGAFNKFLLELIKSKSSAKIIIPDDQLVIFKEALIFAFLGLLRLLNKANCLSTVTGASQNHTGGIIHII